MVNTLSHIGIGLLLSYSLGLKGKKRLAVLFLSVLPDLDYFTYLIFTLIDGSVSHEIRNQLFYLLGHREFTHSVFFALLIALFIWIKTKDRKFTFGGFQAVFLHVLIDYTTSAKMRPFYPFSTSESALRAIYPFDPVINILPLVPFIIVASRYLKIKDLLNIKSRGISVIENSKDRSIKNSEIRSTKNWETQSIENRNILDTKSRNQGSIKSRYMWSRKLGKINGFNGFAKMNERKLYATSLLILLVWIIALPVAKTFLIGHVSDSEGARISYKNTYPISPGKFLAAYSYNETHYKLLEVSYWAGIEKGFYVEKVSVTGNIPDAPVYAEKAGKLYSNSVPQAIDYPVYSVSEENGLVTVVLSDARNPYVEKWPYFDTVYRFIFDRKSGEYEVYESHYGRAEKKLDKNYFK
jgi:inner membrane protein